ncbi:hypothetical protein CIT292_09057 [Citrobacter youngae ATCC 29220]|uniref:Uncharacterized protein n=1 Tax=Citrobacter youngae ATCC 29220 TaxID=500640 RepID=D4BFN7_9ENTR|nr:hypothetical protein CIT292_09057 [Citrobacter youngae ATCC 29220]
MRIFIANYPQITNENIATVLLAPITGGFFCKQKSGRPDKQSAIRQTPRRLPDGGVNALSSLPFLVFFMQTSPEARSITSPE